MDLNQPPSKQEVSRKAIFRQTVLSLAVSLAYFCTGMVRGYSAPAVPSMNEISPRLLPSKNIASWASSIPPFGACIGGLISAPLMHYVGRKKTVLLSSPLGILAWILVAIANRWEYIMAGRWLMGFCAGLTLPAAQVYVSECCDPKIRGVIGSFPAISMSLGILVTFITGTLVDWMILARVCCSVSAFLFLAVCLLPESPVWLKSANRRHQALKAAQWLDLRGFEADYHVVLGSMKYEKRAKFLSWKALKSRRCLAPLGIGMTLLVIQQFSGIDAVIFFTVEIFRAAGSSVDSHLATIIVGAVQLGSNLSSLFIVDRFGRKPLLIWSAIIMSISMAMMGTAFYLKESGNTSFSFLPLVSLIIFMVGFSFGFGSIPFLLMGEIFPTAERSLLSSIAGSFNLFTMFVVIKTYHPLEELITTAGTFWMYSGLCAAGLIFVLFFVPETKGRDLESIAILFEKKSARNGAQVEPVKDSSEKENMISKL